ncbi:undecaprenyldiphospho-muramoylpentapeptide beta-N-acetylglucosaminyltransferase [uncultured Umboniibacter sp.]|uniref:undecaprenyldiphospho-muramoylpentapeptide beta-N-acetylglucosaminyltransferase n=1 Tax=uncultured Umboniibacter sp. TaxID=1798917 RepID=UPI0026020990|nr:undecaprenyldiphospho-muramoylpentapeptide beta-N-acetylglucosaminyltransferase [uncultured Umboniibacter sp.]
MKRDRSKKTILLMAGGTGGHVVPALAVAAELVARGYQVEWLGSERGIESTLVPKQGITLHKFPVVGIRGKNPLLLMKALFALMISIISAFKLLGRIRPLAVVGMGGFASGPGAVAAKLRGVPIIIHEQNAVAGTTNRVLARLASKVLSAFENALPATVIGNPVPKSVAEIKAVPSSRVGSDTRMLVMGGSLGAQALNEMMPKALGKLPEDRRPTVVHQCGRGRVAETQTAYNDQGVNAEVVEFIDTVAEHYRHSDFIVCRSGALTVSEIACAGLPAILVPFPFAVDDHQTANANVLATVGAAKILQQSDWSEAKVSGLLDELTNNPTLRAAYSSAATSVAIRDAAVRAVDIIENVK